MSIKRLSFLFSNTCRVKDFKEESLFSFYKISDMLRPEYMKRVQTGIETFLSAPPHWIKGQRIGLLCNPASVDANFRHSRLLIEDRFPGSDHGIVFPPAWAVFRKTGQYDRIRGYGRPRLKCAGIQPVWQNPLSGPSHVRSESIHSLSIYRMWARGYIPSPPPFPTAWRPPVDTAKEFSCWIGQILWGAPRLRETAC